MRRSSSKALDEDLSGLTVFSLVHNTGTADARVMKEARALREAGAAVYLYCRWQKGLRHDEVVDDIQVVRFECYQPDTRGIDDPRKALGEEIFEVIRSPFERNKKVRDLMLGPYGHYQRTLSELTELTTQVVAATEKRNSRQSNTTTLLSLITDLGGRSRLENEIREKRRRIQRLRETVPRYEEYKELRKTAQEELFYNRHTLFAVNLIEQGFTEKPDVVHAHDLYTLPAGVAVKRMFGAKLIYDAHELEVERIPPLPPAKKSFIDRLERASLKSVDDIITVSEGIAAAYKSHFPNVSLVMNSPEIAKNSVGQRVPTIRSMAGLGADVPLVVYTGGISGVHRGLDKVAEALVSLPGYQLAVLGPRHREEDRWLLDAAQHFGVADRVSLHSPVPATTVPVVIADADVAVCPIQDATLSYRHSMPNKLFEAAYAGIPVCVSNLPDMAAFVAELGIGPIMDQTSPADIAAKLREAVECRDRYKLSAEGQAALNGKYSWAAQKEILLDLYRPLARASRP